ncbi:unnamed protein product [Prunus armeniaca]
MYEFWPLARARVLIGALELKEEKLKAKEEAEDLAQEMAELRYRMTGLLEEECKRRACIEQASLHRIAELESTYIEVQIRSVSVTNGETVVSIGRTFELEYFSLGASKNWYVAILYKKISVTTNVWIGNRNTPLTGSSGVLKVRSPGILGLVDHKNTTVWSSNTSSSAHNPMAQLLDSGILL